jgi:hypothetical protein
LKTFTMQAIMQEAFDSSATVFELALLGPSASAFYMDALARAMLGEDDEMD